MYDKITKYIKRSPLKYMGGKFYMSKYILPFINYNVVTYVEPFLGAGQIFFKKEKHKNEIINDIDNDLINFYLVWKNDKDKLINELKDYPYSKYIRDKFFNEWLQGYKGANDLERAVRYFYILRTGIFGIFYDRKFRFAINDTSAYYYYSSIKLIEIMYERIKDATILNIDYKKLLTSVLKNNEKVMIYCDPPYYGTEAYYKDNTFNFDEHVKLSEILNKMDSNKYIIVSYFYFKELEDLYPRNKWFYYEFERIKSSSLNKKTKPAIKEIIILNYDINEIKKDNKKDNNKINTGVLFDNFKN